MIYKFTATFKVDGKEHKHDMEYNSQDVIKTLERRLKTAFPNAISISITEAK